ncbi:MAG TPA: hypothetical protein VFK16_12150 [Gemmatimonadaceae bacterium]|jgi:hypothetical protein|nr:hypothetical protein [Gemmatimonadaceae bacterium]
MRVSRLYKKEAEVETEVIPAPRIVLWLVIGLLILAGIALYFRYGSYLTPLL